MECPFCDFPQSSQAAHRTKTPMNLRFLVMVASLAGLLSWGFGFFSFGLKFQRLSAAASDSFKPVFTDVTAVSSIHFRHVNSPTPFKYMVETGALGMGRYYIERHMLLPQATMAQLISLICNGVFDKFPSLRFLFMEAGFSWLPHVMWRFDREYKSLRQEVPWVKRKPSEYIRERVCLTTQPTEDLSCRQWLQVIDMIGSDGVVVFSTDYPHFDYDSPERAVPLGLPEELRHKILHENSRRLYGF